VFRRRLLKSTPIIDYHSREMGITKHAMGLRNRQWVTSCFFFIDFGHPSVQDPRVLQGGTNILGGWTMRTTFFAVVLVIGSGGPLWGGPIDPLAFTSLGMLTTAGGGPYTINTSTPAPTLTLPNGSTFNGVVYADTPGHNLAVFDFSSINIVQGTSITATGSLPLVLLSQTDITIGGTINASGGFASSVGPFFLGWQK
jgi:hypothetical protein